MSFWDDITKPVKDLGNAVNDVWSGVKNTVEDIGAWIDKTVADVIPGGWTTLAEVGISFTPAGALGAAGLGAAAGGTHGFKTNKFDLSGAIMGGIGGYGVGSLSQGLYNAGAPGPEMPSSDVGWGENGYSETPADISSEIPANTPTSPTPEPIDPTTLEGSVPPAETNFPSGNEVPEYQASNDYTNPNSAMNRSVDTSTALDRYSDKLAQAGQGVKNIVGLGPQGFSGIVPAAGAVNAGMNYTAYAGLGAVALQEMARRNEKEYESGNTTNEEYEKNKREIEQAVADANANVQKYTYEEDPSLAQEQETLYGKNTNTLYATGGTVDGPDVSGDMTAGGLANGFSFNSNNQMQGYAMGGTAHGLGAYAQGGEPRFLSGGGDGMSDSIKASIDGHQEARLADGEFVIPADVVSHLGNGSSKAGAKQLHAMMDRIRKARTGNPKQGKQINPLKLMPA